MKGLTDQDYQTFRACSGIYEIFHYNGKGPTAFTI